MEYARPLEYSTAESNDPPTIFDVLAQESLEKLIYPAWDSLLNQLQIRGNLNSRLNLAFRLLKVVLDLTSLRLANGSFTELIYGIERSSIRSKSNVLLHIFTLLELHIWPLLKEKFASRVPERLKRALTILETIVKIAYLTGDSRSFSLSHFIFGVVFKQSRWEFQSDQVMSAKLFKSVIVAAQLVLYLGQSGLLRRLLTITSPSSLLKSKNYDSNSDVDLRRVCVPSHPNGFPVPLKAGVCPVCLKEWQEPLALPSGFIYCKSCIAPGKDDKISCPITHTSWDPKSLFSLYL